MSVSEPGKIITPWAESGLKNPIPPAANPATGRAGFDQGFSAINMTAKEAGGIPPFGQDFNGIFYEVTNILRYMQAGGHPTFSSALATAIGGYPKGSMVLGGDGVTLWQSKVDSNFTDPNTDPSDWGTFDIGLKADLAAPGGVGLVGGAWIVPEMFYSGSGPHSAAVQAAFDRSATTGELVYLGGSYQFDVPVTVKNNVCVLAGQKASVASFGGNGTAFDFDAGNANRRFELPALVGFTQVGVPAVAVRSDLSRIYVRQFVNCHTCYKMIVDASNNSILDTVLEFNTMSGCEVALEIYTGATSNVIQGAALIGNFITDTTTVLKRTGVAAYDDGIVIELLAVDFTPRCAGGAFLRNAIGGGHQVPRCRATVKSWFGGEGFLLTGANSVKIVDGQFIAGILNIATTREHSKDNLAANQWRSGEVITASTVASIGGVKDMPLTPTLALFNGGAPLSNTEFIVRLTLSADLAPGAQILGYFYNIWADGSYPRWQATPLEGNTRLMLASIKDQSGTEPSRVELAVRNIDSSPVVAGQSVYFRVSRR